MRKKTYQTPRTTHTEAATSISIALIISSELNDEQWSKVRDPRSDAEEDLQISNTEYGNLW